MLWPLLEISLLRKRWLFINYPIQCNRLPRRRTITVAAISNGNKNRFPMEINCWLCQPWSNTSKRPMEASTTTTTTTTATTTKKRRRWTRRRRRRRWWWWWTQPKHLVSRYNNKKRRRRRRRFPYEVTAAIWQTRWRLNQPNLHKQHSLWLSISFWEIILFFFLIIIFFTPVNHSHWVNIDSLQSTRWCRFQSFRIVCPIILQPMGADCIANHVSTFCSFDFWFYWELSSSRWMAVTTVASLLWRRCRGWRKPATNRRYLIALSTLRFTVVTDGNTVSSIHHSLFYFQQNLISHSSP